MIKLIILDFNGVIVLGSYKDIAKALSDRHDLDFDTVYKAIYSQHDLAALDKIPENEIFSRGLANLGIMEDPKAVEQEHFRLVARRNEDVIAYAQELRKLGYRVIALSKNVPRAFTETVRLAHVEHEFDETINTYDLGLPKGSSETVRWLLEHFHLNSPDEIVFVDDQESNLTQAREMGVHTHLYREFAQMKSFIEYVCSGTN